MKKEARKRMRKRSQRRRIRHDTRRTKRRMQWQRTSKAEEADVNAVVEMRLVFPELGGSLEAGHASGNDRKSGRFGAERTSRNLTKLDRLDAAALHVEG